MRTIWLLRPVNLIFHVLQTISGSKFNFLFKKILRTQKFREKDDMEESYFHHMDIYIYIYVTFYTIVV